MMKMFFIEKEQPELDEETKKLISIYQRNPTLEDFLTLRDAVLNNYIQVLAKKENTLSELRAETEGRLDGEEKVAKWKKLFKICILLIGKE